MATPDEVIRIAESQVGYSRWTDPKTGTRYGRWYADLTGEGYYGENGVAYCAIFVSWAFAQAKQECAGLPDAYCPDMLAKAERAGATVPIAQARPGDVVYFDWGSDGESDHVGIVVANHGSYLETIEGNTSGTSSGSQANGGVVARKERPYNVVCGIVRPNYGAKSDGGPATQTLEIDGKIGPQTVAEWQRQCGTTVDGVVSGQSWECSTSYPALLSVTYEGDGSALMLAVQERIGVPSPTGVIASGTVCMLQGWLYLHGHSCALSRAGVLDAPTAKALQRSLNDGRWSM